MAKSHAALIKYVTIPRLELMATILAISMYHIMRRGMAENKHNFNTDNSICLKDKRKSMSQERSGRELLP